MIPAAAVAAAAVAAPAPGRTWRDPVAYCRAVGTVDRPDGRYVGPKATRWMRAPFVAPAAPADAWSMPVAWRCADHRVMACAYGANIPCDSKADVSRTPGPGAVAFCRENPGSDSIPMVATGHDTIYDWRCEGSRALAGRRLVGVDAQGYIREDWKPARP